MSIKIKIDGPVLEVNETQSFGANGFQKRTFVVETKNPQANFSNPVECTLKKENCMLADNLRTGDIVHAEGWLEGRKWDGPKGTRYFLEVSVTSLIIEKAERPKPVLACDFKACAEKWIEINGNSPDVKDKIAEIAKKVNPGLASKNYKPTDWAKVHNAITGAVEEDPAPEQPEEDFGDPDDMPF